jgi:two-component sensor histidine kinase
MWATALARQGTFLHMNEVDYARVFAALPSPFMILDRQLRYVGFNQAYLDTVNRNREALLGQRLFDIFPNDDESGRRLKESFERVLATGEPDTLAYLLYPVAGDDGRVENRYWTAVHVPIFDDEGRVSLVLQNTVDVTEFARIRDASSLPYNSLSAATRLIERTRETEAASAEFRRLFQQAPAFFAVLSGPHHVFTFSSDSYTRLIGGRNVVGQPIGEALPEVVGQGFIELLDRVYRDGYSHFAESARVMLVNEPGKPAQETFLDFSYNPIRDGEGKITGVFVQGMDRTESVRAQQRQRLLINELNHRVKNTLATVQSIASQTFKTTADPQTARQSFEARIIALSKAHNMLSDREWHDTKIGDLICQELSAYGTEHVRYGGPAMVVNAKATVALALVIHELATNAAKHGALSGDAGRLDVSWREDDGENLVIDWQERGGPPAQQPVRRGFGSRLLHTVVTGELGGELDAMYEDTGFTARLLIPPASYRPREQSVA